MKRRGIRASSSLSGSCSVTGTAFTNSTRHHVRSGSYATQSFCTTRRSSLSPSLRIKNTKPDGILFYHCTHSPRSVAVRNAAIFSHVGRFYTTATRQSTELAGTDDIKELTSPVLYERRIKDLFDNAEKHIDDERWTLAEDRTYSILDMCEQLQKTLTELGKDGKSFVTLLAIPRH